MIMENILCVVAHPDDLEMMAGGSVAKWIGEGSKVHVLTFTDGVWLSPDGKVMRDSAEALREEQNAADLLGYTVENLKYPAMNLNFHDDYVVDILKRIEKLKIDTLVCPWSGDTHHDHEVVARIAVAAGRRVPRIMMGQINYYLNEFFTPNLFVDITDTWEKKMAALKCYKGQWDRAGADWYDFADVLTRYYGKISGVARAEGFVSNKFRL
jgi:LmbE family N-acetylglucosaminyl deacetylase